MRFVKFAALVLTVCLAGGTFWLYALVTACMDISTPVELFIRESDDVTAVRGQLTDFGANGTAFDLLARYCDYKVKTGHYVIKPDERLIDIVRRLNRHEQQPVRLVIPSVRLVSQLPARVAPHLMVDSAQIAEVLTDTAFIASLGFDAQTLPSMIVPNTYEVYWDVKPQALIERLKKEGDRFWSGSRTRKADAIGLNRLQVATIASIVAEETSNNAEKPTVAGLYLNRVKRGMKLEADPTVKFALGDFSLRRILYKHLEVESPYNTYKVEGLPPGPIRIPDIVDIDAVLDHAQHDYIYMCAKEDFSGTHNFARTLGEHLANARRYTNALNKRGIK